jgi:hypothetical protein
MAPELTHSQRRALQYMDVEGAIEFGMGGLYLLLALYFYLQHRLSGSLVGEMLMPFMILVVLGGAWGANRLMVAMKSRLTYPRSGYVAYRRDQRWPLGLRVAIGGGLGALVSAFAGWLAVHRPAGLDWIPLLTGLGFGLAFGLVGWRTALARFFALAVISLAAGMALSILGLQEWAGVPAYYGGMGLLLILTGACVLRNYLRQNPLPQEQIS